ncbi:hypothetical protein GCM10010988_27950 [Cnuibacter physcomitrellae]|nr:hypothetical protein GCM10010988_27950 [Cnuibacter physcomitrellae]
MRLWVAPALCALVLVGAATARVEGAIRGPPLRAAMGRGRREDGQEAYAPSRVGAGCARLLRARPRGGGDGARGRRNPRRPRSRGGGAAERRRRREGSWTGARRMGRRG